VVPGSSKNIINYGWARGTRIISQVTGVMRTRVRIKYNITTIAACEKHLNNIVLFVNRIVTVWMEANIDVNSCFRYLHEKINNASFFFCFTMCG